MLPKLRLLKTFVFAAFLTLFSNPSQAIPYYVVDADPWMQNFNDSAMDYIYGPGNWTRTDYSTPAATIFAATTPFVMLEGSDMNATALANFLSANQGLIESWVNGGGKLFINAAPNQGGNINCGFDNTVLNYPNYYVNAGAINAMDSIFLGPFTPVATSYVGNYMGHAEITGVNMDSLMHGDSTDQLVLAKKIWGSGVVYFGGLTQPNWWSPVLEGENLWYNIFNAATTPAVPTDTGVLDSFVVYASYNCSPLQLLVKTVNYYAGMGVKTWFGDNTTDSSAITAAIPTGGMAVINHNYANSGTYTIKQVLYNGPTVVDSLEFSYQYLVCNTLQISFYYDPNNNCVQDNNEGLISQPSLTQVSKNNVPIDTISGISGFYYTEYGNVGDIFKFTPISLGGYTVTCPITGALIDTLNIGNTGSMSFGVVCGIGSSFDLSVNAAGCSGSGTALKVIKANNAYCSSQNGVVTLNYSPNYAYQLASPLPATNVGQTLTWNVNNLTSNDTSDITVTLYAVAPLAVNDTVMYTISITPTLGDTDATNNTIVIVDTIPGPWDPNHISVSPQGYIMAGTKLRYSVQFENVGNAPAQNIHVLDTLPDHLDVNTFKAITASDIMFTQVYQAGGHNIIKFDFPNINLPDSVHFPDNCTGMFVFDINVKPNVPFGTAIGNKVGIYFDNNEVVMTNTAWNVIGFPTEFSGLSKNSKVSIYPNPVNDELTIKVPANTFTSFSIANGMGQVVTQQEMSGSQTKVNVKQLPAGIYYITLTGANSTEVKKFVKM